MAPIAQVNIRIVDEKDQSATVLFYTDLARFNGLFNGQFLDMEEYFQEVARRLDSLITGRIEALSATILMALPAGIKAAPLLGSDVEERARWSAGRLGLWLARCDMSRTGGHRNLLHQKSVTIAASQKTTAINICDAAMVTFGDLKHYPSRAARHG